MKNTELSIPEWGELMKNWNEKVKAEDDEIRENTLKMRSSINKAKTDKCGEELDPEFLAKE